VLATSRGTDAKRLGQFLRGDLDWIVMKSLEKDRNRRYESPGAFAADIERFLNHDAIAARPPSAVYRLRKLVRRNAAAVAAIGAVTVVLLVGGIVSAVFGVQAKQHARRAVAAEHAAQRNLTEAQETARSLAAARENLRGTLYAAEMNLVQSAWENRQYDRAKALLDKQPSPAGLTDLRGWEWHYWRRLMARGRLRSFDLPELAQLLEEPIPYARAFAGGAPLAFTGDGERLVAIVKPPAAGPEGLDGPKAIVFDGATGQRLSQFALSPITDIDEIPPTLSISDDGARFVHATNTRGQWQTVVRDGRSGEILATLSPLDVYPNPRAYLRVNFGISPDAALVVEVQTALRNDAAQGLTARLSAERTVNIYEAASGKLAAALPPQAGSHARLLWSPDGKQLLCQGMRVPTETNGGIRHEFQLLDARSGQELWSRIEKSNGIRATNLRAWSPDGRYVAVAMATDDGHGQLELWDAATGKTMATFSRPSLSSVDEHNVAFSPDSRMLAHGAENEIHVWDLPEFRQDGATPVHFNVPALTLPNIHGPLRALTFGRNGREIRAVTGAAITAWDVSLRDEVEHALPATVYNVVFGSNATRLAVQEGDAVGIWDASTGQRICTLPLGQRGFNARMTFSHDGQLLALGGMEQYLDLASEPDQGFHPVRFRPKIWLYDAQEGRLLASFDVPVDLDSLPLDDISSRSMYSPSRRSRPSVGEFHFRRDDRQLAFVTPSSPERDVPAQLHVLDTERHAELPPVDLPSRGRRLLGCTPDGAAWVVTSQLEEPGQMASVTTIDIASRSLQKSLEVPGQPIFFEPRKNSVAVIEQQDLVFYDLATGGEQVRLQGFEMSGPRAVSPDARRMAQGVQRAGAIEGQINIWSLETGRRLVTLDGPPYPRVLAFSADGHRLLARSERWPGAQPSKVWDATPLPEADSP
jgi:WD40 repeat protein